MSLPAAISRPTVSKDGVFTKYVKRDKESNQRGERGKAYAQRNSGRESYVESEDVCELHGGGNRESW